MFFCCFANSGTVFAKVVSEEVSIKAGRTILVEKEEP
jgi:hypothetical protein